jgi:hypothetical protein
MLSVYTRHHPDCAKKDDSTYRRCRCPKWLDGTLPGRSGRFRVSAKTKSWEQAELLARKYENSALSGEDLKPAKMPTVKEAVGVFLADAEARGLASANEREITGSTLVARLAGMYAAAKATRNNKDVATVSVRLSMLFRRAGLRLHVKPREHRRIRAVIRTRLSIESGQRSFA